LTKNQNIFSAYQCNPVEYEYFYEDYPEDSGSPSTSSSPSRAPASSSSSHVKNKETNYDIEDLVKAWKEYLKEKKSGKKDLFIWKAFYFYNSSVHQYILVWPISKEESFWCKTSIITWKIKQLPLILQKHNTFMNTRWLFCRHSRTACQIFQAKIQKERSCSCTSWSGRGGRLSVWRRRRRHKIWMWAKIRKLQNCRP